MNSTKNLITSSNLLMECLKSEKIESGPMYGQFLIDSLSSGQGITIGNLLRRVLLGDLQGTAITGVRIAGVKDEFSLISGVREDILEILNKEIVTSIMSTQDRNIFSRNLEIFCVTLS